MIIIDNSNVKLDHLLIFLHVLLLLWLFFPLYCIVLYYMYGIIVCFGSACIVLFSYYVVYCIVLWIKTLKKKKLHTLHIDFKTNKKLLI